MTINDFRVFLFFKILNYSFGIVLKNTKSQISPPISRLSALFAVLRSRLSSCEKNFIVFDNLSLSGAANEYR